MTKEKKTYTIDVDYHYGPIVTYRVEAYSPSEARRRAKARYAKDYFKRTYMKTYIYK